jgi:hypothetical protein
VTEMIRQPHRVERFAPGRFAVRCYTKWKTFNRVLWWVSAMALTRAILYTRNTSNQPTPRGLDLLPAGILLTFGLLWLVAALLGFAGAVVRDGLEAWGRRALAGMFLAWSFIYYALSFYYPDEGSFNITALFYGFMALVAYASKPEIRYVNLVVATTNGTTPRGARRWLVVPERRKRNVPVAVERRHAEG